MAITDQGDAPTVAELAAAMGMRPSSVHYQLVVWTLRPNS
ncbi:MULTISPECIES: hypothetical protein [Streptomyces]|nr:MULTISPECIES: hypothetical protein [Streptomyces]